MIATYALAATASPPTVSDYLVMYTHTPPCPDLAALIAELSGDVPAFRPTTVHTDGTRPVIDRPDPGNSYLTPLVPDHMKHPATIHLSDPWHGLIDPPDTIAAALRPYLEALFGPGLTSVDQRWLAGAGPDGQDALVLDLDIQPVAATRTPRGRGATSAVWL